MGAAVAIAPSESAYTKQVEALAARFGIPLASRTHRYRYLLELSEEGLALYASLEDKSPLQVDFIGGKMGYRLRHGVGRNQILGRAVGMRPSYSPYVIDATAGLGRDGFMLAAMGCHVHLIEQHPVVMALLEDGLLRAKQAEHLSPIAKRITTQHSDAKKALQKLLKPDVIFLDPMFPERRKSALVKKEMQIFQDLLGHQSEDATELLTVALEKGCPRVVVKRPRLAPALPHDREPDSFVVGKTTRFDLYFPR